MMTHKCKVQCRTMDEDKTNSLGITDPGKWMPFIFDMGMIDAAKLADNDSKSFTYNCTTIFTRNGDTYIIDTNYEEFFKKYEAYMSFEGMFRPDDDFPPSSGDDLDL